MQLSPQPIIGAAAVSAFGLGWRGLGRALRDGRLRPSVQTGEAAAAVSEVGPIPPDRDAGDARQRKLMSRAARLAAIAARAVLDEAGLARDREQIGYFLGVGASGGDLDEVAGMLAASLEDGRLSLERLGRAGLQACNPLFTFQLLNNFTLCHGAIATGVGGPNAALFSRGVGTVDALGEATAALAEGACPVALCGGADTALHPVTLAELARQGRLRDGLIPGEGAALLALGRSATRPLGFVDGCAVHPARRRAIGEALDEVARTAGPVDLLVIAPWGEAARRQLTAFAARAMPRAPLVDVAAGLGEALAATPALGWVAALDLLVERPGRALVLNAGTDGDLGAVTLRVPA